MRIELMAPEVIDQETVNDALGLIGYRLAAGGEWSKLELLVAYDWAMRIYYRAADNRVRGRNIPTHLVEEL